MGLRNLLGVILVVLLLSVENAKAYRERRQTNHNQSPEGTFYQPPILLGAAPPPQVAPVQNSYQPPIPQSRQPSNEYRSPLSGLQLPSHEYSASSSQGYILPNQPQSVQYIPPADSSQSFSVLHQPASSGASQSTAERTYSTHSKAVGSAPAQAIHKSPASEIESKKESIAKEKDNKNDEYVVYYYYYYDNDTSANNNLSLNFDDIPSLESYDDGKEPEKSSAGLAPNGNALTVDDSKKERNSSQARSASSASDAFIRADKPLAQPLKPVSNVFRYGSNEVPRFPVLPNFIVSEVPTTTADSSTQQVPVFDSTTTPPNAQLPNLRPNEDPEDESLNTVLDSTSDLKSSEVKAPEEEETTTTTTEPPTTTEIATTTTTEKPRRRPSIGGGRRRFNPSPSSTSAPSFNSNRSRSPTRGTTSSSSTTTTTTSTSPTRRSFQGSSRLRPRPPISGTRSRTTESSEDRPATRSPESTTASTTTARSRFSSASPRRFQSSRSRSQVSSTSTTTRSPTSSGPARPRSTSRPRPNLISRNRPPRPGFIRPRPGSEPEEAETTTPTPEVVEETSPSGANEVISLSTEEESEENDETSEEEESEEPTTTESSRFSALFRPRNRNSLGNRPRPVIGNRPSRS